MLDKFSDFIEIKKSNYSHTRYTIAIPTFKRSETLSNTIKTACDQKFDCDYKIVIVDNNPERNDDTEIFMNSVNDQRISYYKNSQNVGMVNNWNQCIIVSDCDWVVLVHDDDLLTDNCLTNIDRMVQYNPDVDVVLPNFVQVGNPYSKGKSSSTRDKNSRLKSFVQHVIPKDKPIAANLFCDNIYGPPTCGLALRREAVIDFGGYSERCIAADWDFMSKFSRTHKIVKCEGQTGSYIWAVNASMKESTMEQIRKDRITIIKDIVNCSAISRFYYKLLKRDFERKFKTKTVDHVDYSVLYKIIEKYYSMRI